MARRRWTWDITTLPPRRPTKGRRGQGAIRTGTRDRHHARLDRGPPSQPGERRVAILERDGIRVFGHEPVVDGRDRDTEPTGEPAAAAVVLGRAADEVPTAVHSSPGPSASASGATVQ